MSVEENDPRRRRALGVAQLLEQLSRRVQERRGADDLHAAQWSALRYFARAGRQSSNVSGLARYLGNTTGPASRTAKSLIERGYLTSTPSPHDARSVIISVNERGYAALAEDPLLEICDVITVFPDDTLQQLGEYLDEIHQMLVQRRTEK